MLVANKVNKMKSDFEDYWQRLLDDNPILKFDAVTISFNKQQLKKLVEKAFNEGRDTQSLFSTFDNYFKNILQG